MANKCPPLESAAPAKQAWRARVISVPAGRDGLIYDVARFKPTPLWKRSFDVVVAVLLLVALAPLWLLIAVWIKCVSDGPIFFRQYRIGARGEPFRIWKFRTMRPASRDAAHRRYVAALNGTDIPVAKPNLDDELIPYGDLLRRFALDELPQLVNVLKGEMSLVGPRPDLLELEDYMFWQRRRFDVVPGMTGLWQVSGKNNMTFDEMVQIDVAYTRRRSAWLDAKILFWTIPTLLGFDGRREI